MEVNNSHLLRRSGAKTACELAGFALDYVLTVGKGSQLQHPKCDSVASNKGILQGRRIQRALENRKPQNKQSLLHSLFERKSIRSSKCAPAYALAIDQYTRP